MELLNSKLKHKLTFDAENFLAAKQFNRSQRKNHTMIRSFYGNKQNSPYDMEGYASKDQKYIKSLVQTKIEQLHSKMKNFFSAQRKMHLENIAPQMDQLKSSIRELKQELAKPKSFEQIQEEKKNLLKRKMILLEQIEQMNKKMKQNKNICCHLKFQVEDLDRELINGYATIDKYKRKLESQKIGQSKINKTDSVQINENSNINTLQEKNNSTKGQKTDKESFQKLLNESITQQKKQQKVNQSLNNQKQDPKSVDKQQLHSDRVHITQICSSNIKSPLFQNKLLQKLPLIQQKSKKPYLTPNLLSQANKFTKKSSFDASTSFQMPDMVMVIKKNLKRKAYPSTINLTSYVSSSKQSIRHSTIPSTYNNDPQTDIQKIHQYTKRKNYEFDLNMTIKKYQKMLDHQKWKRINQLFNEIQYVEIQEKIQEKDEENCQSYRKRQKTCSNEQKSQIVGNSVKNKLQNISSISRLQEGLMEQLRKRQFISFKQKGYHEGLKDKSHQIRFQLKKLFKNYSNDAFFDQVMKKKQIKKQMVSILQNLV